MSLILPKQNPVDVLIRLYESTELAPEMIWTSYVRYSQMSKKRVYDEAQSAARFRSFEDQLERGHTLAPAIIASDETPLTLFSNDVSAYPFYITTASIRRLQRKKLNANAWQLFALGPKMLVGTTSHEKQAQIKCDFMHHWLSVIMEVFDDANRRYWVDSKSFSFISI